MFVLRRQFCVLLSFLLGICVLTQGADIYISPSAVGGDGSPNLPYGSIQQGIDHAVTGDTIILYNGTYTGIENNVLSLSSSIKSLTLRGFDNDPGLTIISWRDAGASFASWINTNGLTIAVSVQGIGFKDRFFYEDPIYGIAWPTFRIYGGSSLDINNCRFSNITSTGSVSAAYVHLTTTAVVTVRNTDFVNGSTQYGILVEPGNLFVDRINCVNHRGINNAGSCISVTSMIGSVTVNISNSNFIGSQTPLKFNKGNITLTNNTFFNNTNTIACTNLANNTIFPSGNKFCGGGTTLCGAVPIPSSPARPFDGCGVCDGNNEKKDCNGLCFGDGRGSQCIPKKTWWVSPGAVGDGSSRESPLGNIAAALSAAKNGDIILLLAGNYIGEGNALIDPQGKQGILFTSENGNPDTDNVTIFCDNYRPNAFLFRNRESFDTVVQGINIENCYYNGQTPVAIGMDTGVTFKSVNFRHNGDPSANGGVVAIDRGFLKFNDVLVQNTTMYRGAIYAVGATRTAYVSIVNSKFLNNYAWEISLIYVSSGNLEISNSYFVNNDGAVRASTLMTSASIVQAFNNSFYNEGVTCPGTPRTIACSNVIPGSVVSGNLYCGASTTISVGCAAFSGATLSPDVDACGVCMGNNSTMDCSGTCFGRRTSC